MSLKLVLANSVICFSAIAVVNLAFSQDRPSDTEILNEIMNNVSEEYVVCAAYYAMVASAVEDSGDEATANSYKQVYETTIALAFAAAQSGRSEEMAMKVTTARLNIHLDDMESEIENDYSNMSLLMVKHLKRCEWVVNHTDAFFQEWQDKIFSRYATEE